MHSSDRNAPNPNQNKPLSGIVLVLVWCVYMYNRFSGRVSVIVQYKVGHSVGCLLVLQFLPNAHHMPKSILERYPTCGWVQEVMKAPVNKASDRRDKTRLVGYVSTRGSKERQLFFP